MSTGEPAGPAVDRTAILDWLRAEAGFAQVVTVRPDGFPVARTVGAPVNDDWSVDLVQRRVHKRLEHLRQSPRMEIVWVGSPAPGSRNDHPAVFDYGRLVPRVVLLRGVAEFMDEEWTLRRYREQTSHLAALGGFRAPERDDDNVRTELVGVHVRPVRVRVEGFGSGAESFAWNVEA